MMPNLISLKKGEIVKMVLPRVNILSYNFCASIIAFSLCKANEVCFNKYPFERDSSINLFNSSSFLILLIMVKDSLSLIFESWIKSFPSIIVL